MRQALKATRGKGRIEELTRVLDMIKQQLDLRLSISLRYGPVNFEYGSFS